ncbi:glutaminyl-peptide cyclotransferase [Paucihalobacter ruber]|uniref:Glutaminyl-peptide cyclotransferase n=1 Tax=Paucihalobacter ruber TaxID=2567861 RepID=A0A506PGX2_9FLAO|nr:glutaminyl-peptide cyclotransferase [Paucihalobacter ruber]TPV32352.1 glutaminyl-peptide cyclotransferase [Paucihalobacter ruber]
MIRKKLLIVGFIIFSLLNSCGSSSSDKTPLFTIETNSKSNSFKLGDTLTINIINNKQKTINTVTHKLQNITLDNKVVLDNFKLGVHNLTTTINYDDTSETLNTKITILNNQTPKILGFEIINTYPHDITSYTQGLEFYNGNLYESTGQYTESKLRKINYKTGDVLQEHKLADRYFGEGLTILNDKIFQLTWQENTGFVYNAETFDVLNTFKYGKSKEGWGLCNDGEKLYKSDGTENIYILDANTQAETAHIQVFTDKGKIGALNELEWIDGKIYANIYQRNGVVIINPKNGATEAVIDFSSLKSKVKQHTGLDVLNGIAFNPDTQTIFVTGKRWNQLFEVKLTEK